MSVLARFYVSEITRSAYNPSAAKVTLTAASRGEENKTWSTATPSGSMTMSIANGAASDWFAARLGKDVTITIDEVENDKYHLSSHTP